MECNKEEALRAKEIAERKMQLSDYIYAQKLLLKAQRLFPNLDNTSQLIAVCEVHCAAQNKINGYDNWYGILQVEQSADESTIKKQYRKLALLLHPDKNKFFGAEAAFKLVGEANRLLTDRGKRSLYDVKCRANSRGYVSKQVPSQSKTNAGTHHESNTAMNQKASEVAFWTCCQFCGVKYKYLTAYVNRILLCRNCNKSFIAYDVGFEGFPPVSRQVPVSGWEGVPTKTEVGKTGTSEEKLSRKDIRGGKNCVEMPKPDTANQRSRVNELQHGVAKPQSEVKQPGPCAAKLQPEETTPKPNTARSKSPVRKRKPDVAPAGETSPPKSMKSEKKKVVEESSECSDSEVNNLNDREKDKVAQEDVSITSRLIDEEKRRSLRNKRNVSYVENGTDDDFGSTPSKKFKASRIPNSDKEMNARDAAGCLSDNVNSVNSASCAGIAENAVKEKPNFIFEENSLNKDRNGRYTTNREGLVSRRLKRTSNNHSKANDDIMHKPRLFRVPNSDFYDFDKDKTVDCFAVNQVWAVYDPADSMPRLYARVKKIFSSDFKLEIIWLEPQQVDKQEGNGIDMPIACGKFGNGETNVTEDRLIFSHQMQCSSNWKVTFIYPKKGEIWALFRDWEVSWKTDPEKRKPPHSYDIVEILMEYSDKYGIGVCYLGKVKGSLSIYQRAEQHRVLAFHIPPDEIYRFSHRVPSCQRTGTEKGVPAGAVELDPAALPSDMNTDKQSFGSKVDPSPLAPDTKAERMAGPTNKFEEELSNGKFKNLDQNRSNECLNEGKKGVSSKANSSSCRLLETKTMKKVEKGILPTEASKLRRSPRCLSENEGRSNTSQFTARYINNSNYNKNHDDHTEPDDKMYTTKKVEKDDGVKNSSMVRNLVCGLKKTDGHSNGNRFTAQDINNPNYNENHDDHAEPDDKMYTAEKLQKNDCVKNPSKIRSLVCGLKKTDGHSNGSRSETDGTTKQEPNDLHGWSNSSHGVKEDTEPEIFESSTSRSGELNTLDIKKEEFQKNQIWAVYGTNERMPKEYVQIKRIETTPLFKLFVVSLRGCLLPKKNLLHPLCCGVFKVKKEKSKLLPLTSFSHKVQALQVDKNTYAVHPRKGEIWAVYKNDNSEECDIMEVLEDNKDEETIKMASLKCVDRSESLYRATRTGMVEVALSEVARFSHQIPAFQHTGKKDKLRGCWKLNRSAIPGTRLD